MQAWKCSVCQSIFYSEKAPDHCAICGVNEAFFEPQEEHLQETKHTNHTYVIIGGGIAGLSAAKTLRELDGGCHIHLYTKEPFLPYDRKRLVQEFKHCDEEDFSLYPSTWFEEQQIILHLNQEIIRIDPDKKCVYPMQGEVQPYEDLILAMGCKPYLPSLPGDDLEKIFTFTTLQDARLLLESTRRARKVVVIGAGIHGIETACVLADQHVEVELVEMLPSLMAKHLDFLGAELLMKHLKKQKIKLHTGTKAIAYHGTSRVETVELENGKCIDCDFVVVCTGDQSQLSLIKGSGIAYDKGIYVNAHMKTNVDHIYACGDHNIIENHVEKGWQKAHQQGIVAAYNIAGYPCLYSFEQQPLTFVHDNFSLMKIGDLHQMDQSIALFDESNMTYETYRYLDHICSGFLLINRDHQGNAAMEHITNKGAFPKEKELL